MMKRLSTVYLGVVLAAAAGAACPELAANTAHASAAQKQRYGVTVTTDRKADFRTFKSYAWDTAGYPAMDKAVHQQIVDAVDRELEGLGLEKRPSGPADLTLLYGAQRRTDADTQADVPATDLPTYAVGTLVVLMRESETRREVFRGRVDKPIDLAPDQIKATIDEVVAEMFAKYPTRTRK